MRLLHTSDLHLRATDDERWEALETVLQKAVELKAGALVVSGDMFDRGIDAQRLKSTLRERFERHPLPVIILPGNHDQDGLRAGDFFGENVTVMVDSRQPVDVGSARVVGIPYENVGPEAVLDRLLEAREFLRREEGATNVLLFHGELLDLMPEAGAFGDESGYDYMPVRLSTFAGLGFDYVLAGHFHKNYDVRRYDGGYFVYPGSPVSITRAETGLRCAVVVDAGEPPKPVTLDTVHAERLEVRLSPLDSGDPTEEIRRQLDGLHPKALVYLTVGGFVDVEAMGTTERALAESIERLAADDRVVEVSSRWRGVGDILQHELFRRFESHLKDSDTTDVDAEAIREMVIDAMMEAIHAD